MVKALLRSQKLDIFCLQKTKMQFMSDSIVRSLGTGRFLGWEAQNSMESAGGVLVVWDKISMELLDKEVGSFLVSCRFKNVNNNFVCVLFGVYSPLYRDGRSLLMEELSAIRGLWEDPWCIGGTSMLSTSPRSEAIQED